jgi:para-aminobenzoate synthetase/4-amino-4-deoxychorismate lyase
MPSAGQTDGAVSVVRVPLDELRLSPERAALLVRADDRPFALIGRWAGGGALIGSEPTRVATSGEDPFALLDDQPILRGGCPVSGFGAGGIGGGWFGYLGYELGRWLEPVGASPPGGPSLPPFALAFYDHVMRLDADGRWWFEALWSPGRADALNARLDTFRRRAAAPSPEPRHFATGDWRAIPRPAGHALAVEACRRRIHAGDLFQANICTRLESRLHGAPIDLFVRAAADLEPDRAAFLSGPWGAIASLSPELFLERHGRDVRSAPIKGTRPAGEAEALRASSKDRAENVMIVDLVRNDLGRVCVPGTIRVDSLARTRAHVNVAHLVSEVSGTLRDRVGDGELTRAAFPPGSVTGAPKVAALNVIAELESTPRGVYTGAIGFASPAGGLELSVAIRTFEITREHIWLGVGGGIVADSDPAGETAECATKAAPLLGAIGASIATGPATSSTAPVPRRLAPRPIARPDPRAGVFETILVSDGRPVAVERHLSRLARSVRALYGGAATLPPELSEDVHAHAADADAARMRVNARPCAGDIGIDVELTDLAPRQTPVLLVPVTVPGGLGAHKWIDRSLLTALSESSGGEPLLCDLDGVVLESARASVFCVEPGGRLVTPPADGRILPGVTRARVLELAPRAGLIVSVEPVSLGRLRRAAEIFVTGALGGVEPAQIDAASGAGGPMGPVGLSLAGALARTDELAVV